MNRTCPWCDKKPVVDKDMNNQVYCDTDGCPIKGIMMTPKKWNSRLGGKNNHEQS